MVDHLMKDLMIDLETLGNNPDAVVISIGAVFFDIETGKLGESFYLTLDINEQIDRGRKPNGDTIKWWMKQGDQAKLVFEEETVSASDALKALSAWYEESKTNAFVWGNGATFDISILENMFGDYDIGCPWSYRAPMDVRTFRRFVAKNAPMDKVGTVHNALDDAINQAKYIMQFTSKGDK